MGRTVPQLIGGPGTCFPTFLESFLSWALCIVCLSVSGYHHFVRAAVRSLFSYHYLWLLFERFYKRKQQEQAAVTSNNNEDFSFFFSCGSFLPITTYSRREVSLKTPKQRHDQLLKLLRHLLLPPGKNARGGDTISTCNAGGDDENVETSSFLLSCFSDNEIVSIIRSNDACRRLASLTMLPREHQDSNNSRNKHRQMSSILIDYPHFELPKRLARLWHRLLELPPSLSGNDSDDHQIRSPKFQISVVIPAFREDGNELWHKLKIAHKSCHNPSQIEIIFVDAGGCRNMDKFSTINRTEAATASAEDKKHNHWGRIQFFRHEDGGGRGPCLNSGAEKSNGEFLVFLHSDTVMPSLWDTKIIAALRHDQNQNYRANSCAFSFGIDTTPAGLNGNNYPTGIKAVTTTANWRTHLYSLPYGDQVLSLPASVFFYLGGFPDQCLMEDYELVDLLRRRQVPQQQSEARPPEKMVIIGGEPAWCSPRRWQKFGVLYVTYMNSTLVNLYANGMSDDDLFMKYYLVANKRKRDKSPWEITPLDNGIVNATKNENDTEKKTK